MPTEPSTNNSKVWLLASLLLINAIAWLPWIDREADGFYEQALTRALITFGLARGLNGIISVVQGTEVGVQPAGVGVTFTPGELLDPLNDMVERFSWIMLVSSTSLGMQKILMDISAWNGVRFILLFCAVLLVFAVWCGDPRFRAMALRLFAAAMFLRFAMPMMVVLNHGVYQVFMADDYNAATELIETATQDLETMQAEQDDTGGNGGWMASIGRWFDGAGSSLDIKQKLSAFTERVAETTEQLLKLAAVFVLQSIVLPLLFLWLFMRGLRNLSRVRWWRPEVDH